MAVEASQILFGKGTYDSLVSLDERTLLAAFDGVPMFDLDRSILTDGVHLIDLLASHTTIFSSRGEARRMLQAGGLSLNKKKPDDPETLITVADLIRDRFMLIQKGKKQYYLIRVK
jgi:tyrosyl-tRNA synthetase